MGQNSDDSSGLPIFIDGLNLGEPMSVGSVKHFHKKSRTGCQRCRSRRVKCDEVKPHCGRCKKHEAECVYDRIGAATASKKPPIKPKATPEPSPTEPGFAQELGESEQRRLEELELLHFYMSKTGPSIAFDDRIARDIFMNIIPRAAITSKVLLYGVMATTALHKITIGNQTANEEFVVQGREQYDRYFPLAIRYHRQDCDNMTAENVDRIFLTACVLRISACYNVSVRSLEPYTPPTEWLRLLRSHYLMYQAGWKMAGDRDTHIAKVVSDAMENWQPLQDGEAAELNVLGYIFEPKQSPLTADYTNGSTPGSECSVDSPYTTALHYLNGIIVNMRRGKARTWVLRQIGLTPLILEDGFYDLLDKFDPKALVLSAHLFAMLTMLDGLWHIGRWGYREVEAIVKFLPQEWQHMLVWPQKVCATNLRDYPNMDLKILGP